MTNVLIKFNVNGLLTMPPNFVCLKVIIINLIATLNFKRVIDGTAYLPPLTPVKSWRVPVYFQYFAFLMK